MENRSHVGAQSFRRRRMVLSSTLMALFLFTVDATCSVGTTTVPSIRHHYTLGNRRQRQTAAPGREGLQVPRQHDTRNSRITKLQLVLNQLRCGAAALRSSEVTVTSTTSGDQETKGVVASSSSIPTQVSRTTTTAASETTTATPGSHGSAPVTTIKSSVSTTSSLRTIYAVSFLIFLSSSLVALSPVQALQQRLDASRATQVLSALSATAALMEITTSGMVGSLLDVTGRKPALTTIVGTLVLLNTCTALVPNVLTICLQRLVGMLSIGFFFLTSQTILSDIVVQGMTATAAAAAPGPNPGRTSTSSSSSSLVSAAMGQQMALTGLGFLLGILGAGQVSEFGLPVVYSIAAGMGMVALLLIQFGLTETMPQTLQTTATDTGNIKGRPWLVLQSPLSCTRLLTRHGSRVQTLGMLLMLMTLPTFMGDFFQVFAKQEWQLSTKSFSTFLALFGIVGIAANTAGSILVKAWGIKTFTTVAVMSKLLTMSATLLFGYKGSIVGLILGFLGSAQSIGIVAALIAEGTKSGLPLGEMAGERASLVAFLKVVGPILYSTLYLQGQRWLHTSYLPFLFNVCLSLVALVISHLHL